MTNWVLVLAGSWALLDFVLLGSGFWVAVGNFDNF